LGPQHLPAILHLSEPVSVWPQCQNSCLNRTRSAVSQNKKYLVECSHSKLTMLWSSLGFVASWTEEGCCGSQHHFCIDSRKKDEGYRYLIKQASPNLLHNTHWPELVSCSPAVRGRLETSYLVFLFIRQLIKSISPLNTKSAVVTKPTHRDLHVPKDTHHRVAVHSERALRPQMVTTICLVPSEEQVIQCLPQWLVTSSGNQKQK
jgi:hypothetical protein